MNHIYQSAFNVWLLSHYTLFGLLCTDVCLLSYIALYWTTLHIVQLSCSVGSPAGGGWRYLLAVTIHPSSHPSPWSKQKAVGRWRERWCSGGTPSPTCWRQSMVQSGCTEEVPWREADEWVWRLLCLCVCILLVQVWVSPICLYLCVCFEYTMPWLVVERSCFISSYPLLGVTLSYWFSAMFVKWYRRNSLLRLQVFES